MDYEIKDLQDTKAALIRKWSLPEFGSVENSGFDTISKVLAERIKILLDEDFESLVNAMYRMDIPENHFHEALTLQTPDEIANALAEVVIQREILRVKTWNAWKQRKQNPDSSQEQHD